MSSEARDPDHFIIEDVPTPRNISTVRTVHPLVRLWRLTAVRRVVVVLVVLLIWEVAARWTDKPLLLPSVLDTLGALRDALLSRDDNLWNYIAESLKALSVGFAIGTSVAAILTIFAINTRIGED